MSTLCIGLTHPFLFFWNTGSSIFAGTGIYEVLVSGGRDVCSSSQERIGFYNRSCSAGVAQWTDGRAGPLLRDGTTEHWYQFTITKVGEANGQDLVTIESWYPTTEDKEPRCMGYIAPYDLNACNEAPDSGRLIINPAVAYQWRIAVSPGGESIRFVAQDRKSQCRRFLTVSGDCSTNEVSLALKDYGNGRQRWVLLPTPTESPELSVTPVPVTPPPKILLPTTSPPCPTIPPISTATCPPCPTLLLPYNDEPSLPRCDGFGEVISPNGQCVCDTANAFIPTGNGGCDCNTEKNFVRNGNGGCECDAESNFVLNSNGECEYCDPFFCVEVSSPRSRRWSIVGGNAFYRGVSSTIYKTIVGGNNAVYIALKDVVLQIFKYQDSLWQIIADGDDFDLDSLNSFELDMARDPTDPNALFVAFYKSGGSMLMRYNGKSWKTVAAPFTIDEIRFVSLAISSDGTPFIGFKNSATSFPTVRKLNAPGTDWETVGEADFGDAATAADYLDIALDSSDAPYVVYGRQNTLGFKFEKNTWKRIGDVIQNKTNAYISGLEMGSDGVLYACYDELQAPGPSTGYVKRYDDLLDEWVFVGETTSPKIQFYGPMSSDFALGPGNTPTFVASSATGTNIWSDTLSVWILDKDSDSWISLGAAGFGIDASTYNSLAFAQDGTAYVAAKTLKNPTVLLWAFN